MIWHRITLKTHRWGIALIVLLVVSFSLYISHSLVEDLAAEERVKMELWAEAMKNLQNADMNADLSMVLNVLNANNTIPVIVTDQHDVVQLHRNIELSADSIADLHARLRSLKDEGHSLYIDLNESGDALTIYYGNSLLLRRLAVYPYLQLLVAFVFVAVVILALLNSKKAEQNRLWLGLSKETAHQLGTPISSLMAWTELLKAQYPDDNLLPALSEDVARLQAIANRFSKIGSVPELAETDLRALLERVIDYMKHRTSERVKFVLHMPETFPKILLNAPLFEWVIENLCKNAVDAMDGEGMLVISAGETAKKYYVEVEDTGKGIDKRHFRTVFRPGYTTKARGWGLGLSLVRRIVVEYHHGHIFVKQSEINKGTIFRIELKK